MKVKNLDMSRVAALFGLTIIMLFFSIRMQAATTCSSTNDARQLVANALSAQGGEDRLRAIRSVQIEASASRFWVEESERPEGPYIQDYQKVSELRDFANGRIRHEETVTIPSFPMDPFTTTWVADREVAIYVRGGKAVAGTVNMVQEGTDRLALAPERVLLSALESDSLSCDAEASIGSVNHRIVKFRLQGAWVRVFLNANTGLPGLVESSGPSARDGFWKYLGDVTMRERFTTWMMLKGGIRYPMQWNIERNGIPDQVTEIHQVTINSVSDDALVIPQDVREQFKSKPRNSDPEQVPLGSPDHPAKEYAPGILEIPSSWNITLIDQGDGIVVLEAPISSGYSARVIEEAGRRFPRKSIKAVITTSDAWPHVAGIREYVAHDIPIYALDLNREIINRMMNEPRSTKPDTLSGNPREAKITWISEKTVLGTGSNRIEIYPLRGATTERQMMVYFPGHRLLYGSDAFQRQGDTLFVPQTVSEVMDAVRKDNLIVEKFFMMHMELSDWVVLESDYSKAISQ